MVTCSLRLNIVSYELCGEGSRLLGRVGRMLELLAEDGGWHSVEEVARAAGLTREKTEIVLRKLSEFGFVELREDGKVRVDPELRELPLEEELE